MDAGDWDDRYREKPLLWSAGPNEFVAADLADLTPGTALDVACGEGRNAVWLAGQGWKATGIDFSPVALERARGLASEHGVEVEWLEADVLTWDTERRFDLVLVSYLHLPPGQRDPLMERIVSWVAPGGYLYLVGHDVATAGVSGPPYPDLLWTPEHARQAAGPLQVRLAESRPRETAEGETAQDTVLLAERPEE